MFYYIKKYPFSCILIVAIWVACMVPVPETPLDEINLIDKWTHFVMYGMLTIVIWWEYKCKHGKQRNNKRLLAGGVLCPVAMGIVIELAQAYLTTCRSGDWFDALCNTLGVAFGAGIASLVFRIRKESVV